MQRYFVKNKREDYLELEKSDVHHIKNVMRYSILDKIECVYEGILYLCEIVDLSSEWVHILSSMEKINSNTPRLAVAIALVKEQKMDLILQKLTELGVSEIIPVMMERCVVKISEEKVSKKMERWQKICKEASEQSKRVDIPLVYRPIMIDDLAGISYERKFVCSTKKMQILDVDYFQSFKGSSDFIFVIGPEGGLTNREEEKLFSFGYSPVSFGSLIMRVETAAIYVASIVNFMK